MLGPATDGGYWAIGVAATRPDALLGVPMSTATTYRDQLDRLDELGLRTLVLAELCDVDTFEEALTVARMVPTSRFAVAVEAVRQS